MDKINPFDYVNQISYGKKDLIVDDISEKSYVPFLTNRSLSYHQDCVLFANEMNRRHHLDKKLQFSYLINTVRGRKRPYVKWSKAESPDDLECVKLAYGYSDAKSRQILPLLTPEQLADLKRITDTGGIIK
jgi:hypothetical protein